MSGSRTKPGRLGPYVEGYRVRLLELRDVAAARRRRQHRDRPHIQHADVRSTQPYIHADMTIRDRALALVTPATVAPGRYTPTDDVLAYLDSLA